jgi:malonyl-CoA O-methyltransferase
MMAPLEAYARWASTWDDEPNALVALESAWMSRWLERVRGLRVVDAGCGTGRWLVELRARGARAVGFDFSPPMLAKAAAKHCLVALADIHKLPLPDGCADIVLCALGIGHVADARSVLGEFARVTKPGGAVLLSDFHPEAYARGWRRTFRHGGAVHEVLHHPHAIAEITVPGLTFEEFIEPAFDERQQEIFRRAGKPELFEQVRGLPALVLARWRRTCD